MLGAQGYVGYMAVRKVSFDVLQETFLSAIWRKAANNHYFVSLSQ